MAEGNLGDPIGLPLDRVDGRLKVTGRATYAFEYAGQGGAAYGVIVPGAIAKGRVVAVDVRHAERAPGVLLVLTKDNAPPQSPWGPVDLPDRFARAEPALDSDEVRYFGFPVAFVVAETFEQATAAAALVRVRYESLPGQFNLGAPGSRAEDPGHISDGAPADSSVGDFETAFATAPVNIEAIYTTPYQNQAPMEPHATMAVWEGQMLTVHTSAQLTTSPQEGLARTLNIPKENVRVITRYVGGGFGNKLPFYVDATLAAIGARFLRRPVKVAMTRPQLFHMTTHRTASEQVLRLGADRDGRLTAYGRTRSCNARASTTTPNRSAEQLACSMPPPTGLLGIASQSWICRARILCAPQATRSVCLPSNAQWTSWPTLSGSIQWICGYETTPRSIPSETGHSPPAISPKRCARVRPASVGINALQSRPVYATGAGSSVSVSPPRSAPMCCEARPRVRASRATAG
jgi:xanthine dehydrogenase YagR molybdenum-binding subunit